MYMKALSQYPKWKLLRLDEYHPEYGKSLEAIVKFLDALQSPPEDPYSAIGYDRERKLLVAEPESQAERRLQMALDFNAHIQKVMKFKGSREDRLRIEMNSFKELDKKYPHLNVWDKVKGEKRFQGFH